MRYVERCSDSSWKASSQSNTSSVERVNQDIQNMLTTWMDYSDTNKCEQIANVETEEQLEETGNTSEKKLSGGHTENHIPKKNFGEDLENLYHAFTSSSNRKTRVNFQ
ncbi:hypothetical protein TNCV_3470571 [Trichonephila clavipes]|nr:hypothetical protein TNCV_3470571 [Trichonephila clavipes]